MSILTRPVGLIHQVYVAAETKAAGIAETVVGSGAFGELLAISASNAMATMRVANGVLDRGIGALRVAGRSDVTDLSRQLARTEDKLERMLQLVEDLGDRLDPGVPDPGLPVRRSPANNGSKRSHGSNGSNGRTAKGPKTGATASGRPS